MRTFGFRRPLCGDPLRHGIQIVAAQPVQTMIPLERIVSKLRAKVPGAKLEIIANPAVGDQPSLRVDRAHALEVARLLRDEAEWHFDTVSNVTGVDWLDSVEKERVEVRRLVDGAERVFEDFIEIQHPGRLEVVYHLYSVALRHGPLVIRLRTGNRKDQVSLPSLTPIWRSCELQEREVYDLYGVEFEGHPDLRRLLMWPEFRDHPMRKDYVDPDDYEYEPTPHDNVLKRAEEHRVKSSEGGPP